MDNDRINIIFKYKKNYVPFDLDVPINITVNELIIALNSIFNLEIDVDNINNYYVKTENPINLLNGSKMLNEYGLHNGSVLYGD